jgi:hypothetical protein
MSTESVPQPVRSLSEDLGRHLDARTHGIGLGVFAIMAIVVLPLPPLLAAGWPALRAVRAARRAISGADPADPGDGLRRVVKQRANEADTSADGGV